jgi:hypothetical protein
MVALPPVRVAPVVEEEVQAAGVGEWGVGMDSMEPMGVVAEDSVQEPEPVVGMEGMDISS